MEAAMAEESPPLTRKERLNRNIMIFCGLVGAVIGIALVIAGGEVVQDFGLFSFLSGSTRLATPLALALAAVWCIIMPIVAWLWHRDAIDEQEAAAYRDGAYYAAYTYLIVAPTWWVLWRGGLLPEPNGVFIFIIFNSIWLTVWFWKKYR
jgi:hypothetical protein